jgi:hypothetical protein
MNNITKNVKRIVASKNTEMAKDETFRGYENALKMYKDMVSKGLVTPRGNQIMNTEERYRNKIIYNSSQ